MIGIMVNTANPMKFGAINEYAVNIRFRSRIFLLFFKSTTLFSIIVLLQLLSVS